jgi:hypothetical protein
MPTFRSLSLGGALNRTFLGLVLAIALLAVITAAAVLVPTVNAEGHWQVRLPLEARRTGTFRHPRLTESSGVVASRRYPGVLWTLNDSDNPAEIFATDSSGSDLGSFTVRGAKNEDWEAITAGPCGGADCLYIADTGDNEELRHSVRLYRVPEPAGPLRGGAGFTARAEALEVRYPDGPHDVEAALVAPDGAVLLVSKGRTRGVRAFRIPASGWSRQAVTATPLGRLPIATGGLGAMVTDAALAPDGIRVAIRTYLGIFLFHLTPEDTFLPLGLACDVAGLELQGEGIAWLDDDRFVLTSEGAFGAPGTVTVVRCPTGPPGRDLAQARSDDSRPAVPGRA